MGELAHLPGGLTYTYPDVYPYPDPYHPYSRGRRRARRCPFVRTRLTWLDRSSGRGGRGGRRLTGRLSVFPLKKEGGTRNPHYVPGRRLPPLPQVESYRPPSVTGCNSCGEVAARGSAW
jgi:hypothetical protein